MSNKKKWSNEVGIQLLRTCMEWIMSRVLSKKGRRWEILMYKGTTALDAMKLLKGPLKFIEVVTMVMFLSRILTAKVATPPPISSPILIVPGLSVARRTSSMEKSRLWLLVPEEDVAVHRVFSRPSRSKQSLQSSNSFCLCFLQSVY